MSRVDDVERLLQVLQVLRAAEGYPVRRSTLVDRVTGYASSAADEASLKRMMQRDVVALRELGFRIDDAADEGAESTFVLRPCAWRLPVELDPYEQGLLVWVMAAGGAAADESGGASDLSNLLGRVPREIDMVQSAIARGLRLRLEREGEEVEFEPAQLASRQGRWFVVGRYAGSEKVIAPRLDGLVVLGLGGPINGPIDVGRLEERLDPTSWDVHERRDVELRCGTADLAAVRSWFPRAVVEQRDDGTSVLRSWTTNEEALVTRVIGLAGIVWAVSPTTTAAEIRRRAELALAAR